MGCIFLSLLVFINQWYFIPLYVIEEGSAAAYPYMLNGGLAFLTLCYILESLWLAKKNPHDKKEWIACDPASAAKVLGLLALIWLWGDCLNRFGFIIPTSIFLASAAYLYGERTLRKIGMLMVIFPLGVFILFTLLHSALPQGPLENWLLLLMRGEYA